MPNGATSIGLNPVPAEAGAHRVSLPTDNIRRQCATVVKEAKQNIHLTVRSRSLHQPDETKQLLQTKISTVEIKVGSTHSNHSVVVC